MRWLLLLVAAGTGVVVCSGFVARPRRDKNDCPALTAVGTSKQARRFVNVDDMLDSLHVSVGVVVFTAAHCGPCRLQKQELVRLLRHFGQEKVEDAAADSIMTAQRHSNINDDSLITTTATSNSSTTPDHDEDGSSKNVVLPLMQQQLPSKNSHPIQVLTIETEKWPYVCQRFDVTKLPCLLITQGSHVVWRLERLVSAEELLQLVRQLLGGTSTKR
jgi:hypothetical protein